MGTSYFRIVNLNSEKITKNLVCEVKQYTLTCIFLWNRDHTGVNERE